MKRDLAFMLVVISALIIFSATLTPSVAADYNRVGVKAGDTLEYSISEITHWTMTNESGTFHYDREGPIDRLRVYVNNVVETSVTLTWTFYDHDGLVRENETITIDVYSGLWDYVPPMPENRAWIFGVYQVGRSLVIAANLTAGDPIHEGSGAVINETIDMDVAGSYRIVSYVKEILETGGHNGYWDKESGWLVWLSLEFTIASNMGSYPFYVGQSWFNLTLTHANLPPNVESTTAKVDPTTTLFVAVATVAAITLISALADRRRRT